MSKYIWCEDSGAGYHFWQKLFEVCAPDVIVESKGNNTRLRKAVENLTDDSNEYFILMDNALDNEDVLREVKRMSKIIKEKSNVKAVQIHSFEFALLSFKFLDHWVFADKDELKEKRRNLLEIKDYFVRMMTEGISAYEIARMKALGFLEMGNNTEQRAAKLLWNITRNTGFETDKGHIGDCFIVSCCDWMDRKADDICGLDGNKINYAEKMMLIKQNSVLRAALERVGI